MDSTSNHHRKIQLRDLSKAYSYTKSICPNWELFGIQLGIPDWIIRVIDKDKNGCEEKLMELLARWLQQRGTDGEQQCTPSWKTLSETVRHFDASIADEIHIENKCNCQECVATSNEMQQESPVHFSLMGGAEPSYNDIDAGTTKTRVGSEVENQDVVGAFKALQNKFDELTVSSAIKIASANPVELRGRINNFVAKERFDNTAIEDHFAKMEYCTTTPAILNYLVRHHFIGPINYGLLSVIKKVAKNRRLDKEIELYEKDCQCFLQLSLIDLCTAYKECPELHQDFPVGLPKFTIHLESEWEDREAKEWKELLEQRFRWAKHLNIVRIRKNCIVITYAVWPSMAKAVAYDLTNSEVVSDLKAHGVTHVEVSPQLRAFMDPKEEIELDKEFPVHEDVKPFSPGEDEETKATKEESNDSAASFQAEAEESQPVPFDVEAKSIMISINEIESELKKIEHYIEEQHQEKDSIVSSLHDMKMMIDIDNGKATTISRKECELENELKKKEKEINYLREMKKKMMIDIDKERTKLKEKDDQIKELESKIQEKDSIISNSHDEMKLRMSEIDKTRERTKEFEAELKKKKDDLTELESKIQEKDSIISDSRDEMKLRMSEIDEARLTKEELKTELKKKEDQTKKLETELKKKEDHVNVLEIKLEIQLQEIQKKDEKLRILQEMKTKMMVEIDNGRAAETKLKQFERKLQKSENLPLQREKVILHLRKQLQMARRRHYFDSVKSVRDSYDEFAQEKINQVLLSAVEKGNESEVEMCLKQGADPVHTNKDGFTALHLASSKGHVKVVEVLLLAGVDVDTKTDDGTTSLHRASYGGHIEVVNLLINNGASVEACTKNRATPLHRAASNNRPGVVETLLRHGANIEAKTDAGSTSLHFASAGGHVEAVEVLIFNGAFIEAQDMKNATPLHRAASGGYTDTVNVLLLKEANLKAMITDGSTPLHKASEGGHSEVVEQLLSKNAPVGLKTNREKQTPLHLSTLFGHVRASKLLISHGASVSVEDKYDQTPALIAIALNNTEVIEHMLQNSKLLPEDVEKYRLPSNWSASRDAFDGRIQYRNKMTGLRQYDHPAKSQISGKS